MLPLIAASSTGNNSMSEMECYSEQKRQRFLMMADPLLGRLSFLSSISSNPTTTDHHIRVPSSSSSWYDDKRQCSPPSAFSSSSLENQTNCDDIKFDDGDGINIDDDDDYVDLDKRQQRQHGSNDNKNKQLSNWITMHCGCVRWDVLISYLFLPLMVELQFAIAAATMTSHVNYHSNHDMESGTNPIPVLVVVGAGTSPRPWSVHFAIILYLVSSYLYRLTLQEEGLLLLARSLARSSLSSSSSSSSTSRNNNNALQWWSILPDLSLDAVLAFILMQRPMTAFFTLVGTVLFMSCVTSLVAIWRLMLQYRSHGHQHQQMWQDIKLIDETTQHSSFYLPPSPPPKQGLVRKASLPKIPRKSCYVPLLHGEECHGDCPDIDETESSYYEDDRDDHDIYYYYNNYRGSGGNDDDDDELDVCCRPVTARQHVAV